MDLVPARVVEPLDHSRFGGLDRADDDCAAELERREQLLQLLRLQPELRAQVFGRRRPGCLEVIEHERPVVLLAHPLDLRANDRIEQACDIGAHVERLAPVVHLDRIDARAAREREAPAPFRARPLPEARLVRCVRLLMTGLEQAREGRVRRPGQHPAFLEEPGGLVERLEGPVRGQPAEEAAALLEASEPRIRSGCSHVFPAKA